ncbi:hypothetical protein P9139_04315 [Curtobacterium flaccumfaciens]|nr:hypothetical protein P9139_04315 [Curtobacterium flaccumfaciens]
MGVDVHALQLADHVSEATDIIRDHINEAFELLATTAARPRQTD